MHLFYFIISMQQFLTFYKLSLWQKIIINKSYLVQADIHVEVYHLRPFSFPFFGQLVGPMAFHSHLYKLGAIIMHLLNCRLCISPILYLIWKNNLYFTSLPPQQMQQKSNIIIMWHHSKWKQIHYAELCILFLSH